MFNYKGAEVDFTAALELGVNKVPSELEPLLWHKESEESGTARTYANRGIARGSQGNFEGALEDLTQAINLGESDGFIVEWRARVQRAIAQHETQKSGFRLATTGKRGQDLWKQDFSGEDLSGRDFADANLTAANLTNAILYEANLQGALLASTNLQQANLRNTNMQNTRLIDANLSGADLTLANLEGALIAGAKFSETTRLPDWVDNTPNLWGG
jgi:uncharacterized protein YjbI with pentapeptide repeats